MSPACDSLVGRRVDRYDVLALIGRGGFGAVYRARHAVLGTEVALKVLFPERAGDPANVERFLREARAAAMVGSPHIVHVADAGTTPDGTVFLAMELLHGRDLAAELEHRVRFDVADAVEIARQVLAGLTAAHRRGIVHRDLKPANVFLATGPDGAPFVKLLDFGISKITGSKSLTQSGIMLGTPHYMAPEQIRGARDIDPRADIYAAGCMLHEMITGRTPFEGGGVELLVRRVSGEAPPRLRAIVPTVPDAIDRVVARAIAADRDARWPSAEALADALVAALDGSYVEDAAPTVPPGWRPAPLAPAEPATATMAPAVAPKPAVYAVSPPAASPARFAQAAAPAFPATASHPVAVAASPTPEAHPVVHPSAPVPTPQAYPTPAHGPPVDPARGLHPGIWAAFGALAVMLAGVAGAIGVGLHRRYVRDAAPVTVAPPALPTPGSAAPSAPSVPAPVSQPIAIPSTPAPLPPPRVSYEVVSVLGSRSEVDAALERARPGVAQCAHPGRELRVAVSFIATLGGEITVSHPSSRRRSDDEAVAHCVAQAIRAAGPLRLHGTQTAIVEVDVVLPAG